MKNIKQTFKTLAKSTAIIGLLLGASVQAHASGLGELVPNGDFEDNTRTAYMQSGIVDFRPWNQFQRKYQIYIKPNHPDTWMMPDSGPSPQGGGYVTMYATPEYTPTPGYGNICVDHITTVLKEQLKAGKEYTLSVYLGGFVSSSLDGQSTQRKLVMYGAPKNNYRVGTFPAEDLRRCFRPNVIIPQLETLVSHPLTVPIHGWNAEKTTVTFTPTIDVDQIVIGVEAPNDGTRKNFGNTLDGISIKATAATLTLQKRVINNDGRTATAADFTLTATGPSTITGIAGSTTVTNATVAAGNYTLSETGPAGYTQLITCTGTADTNLSDGVDLVGGENAVCTFNNDDTKIVTNLNVTKTASASKVNPGETLTYTITVTDNADGIPATDVVASDTLDAAFTSATVTCSDSAVVNSTVPDVSCTWANIADGETRTMTVQVTAP